MKNYKFKTPLACDIARVDRAQLNEAIAKGFYDFAPKTTKGSVRVFDVYDTVMLTVFGWLVRLGMSSKDAGAYASLLFSESYSQASELGTFVISPQDFGAPSVKKIDRDAPVPTVVGRGKVRFALFVDLDVIRAEIVERGEWENNNPVLGDDD